MLTIHEMKELEILETPVLLFGKRSANPSLANVLKPG